VDVNGNTYVTGRATTLSPYSQVVTIKYNTYGIQQWIEYYPPDPQSVIGTNHGKDIALDSDGNVYVACDIAVDGTNYDNTDIYVLKYNGSNGSLIWHEGYARDDIDDHAQSIAVDPQKNAYVTGFLYYYNNTLGNCAWFVRKYTTGGAAGWTVINDYSPDWGKEIPTDIVVDNNERAFVTGQVQQIGGSNVDYATFGIINGVLSWQRIYPNNGDAYDDVAGAVTVDNFGHVFVTGSSIQHVSTHYREIATLKYDCQSGAPLAEALYHYTPGTNNDWGYDIVCDPSGSVYLTGSVVTPSNGNDFATLKYKPDLSSFDWPGPALYNRSGLDAGLKIALDANSDVYVTGSSLSLMSNQDYTTLKIDGKTGGDPLWTAIYDNGTEDQVADLALDPAGNVYVTGRSVSDSYQWDYATVKYNQHSGAFTGTETEPSQGRHLVRDPMTGEFHLVMHRISDNAILYTKSTDSGNSWVGLSVIGTGQYPTVCVVGGMLVNGVICVAYKPTSDNNSLIYKWFDPNLGYWQSATLGTGTNSNPGPPSIVTNGYRVYVAYRATESGQKVKCKHFDYFNPGSSTTETMDATSSPDQPCLAVDGNGYVYGAWRRQSVDQVWYSPRANGNWKTKLRVDRLTTPYPSQQPFVECYGDSVYVTWADREVSQSEFDVWRVRKQISAGNWRDWVNISYTYNIASESPTQAWREFTTWSEWSPGPQPDIYFWRPTGMTGDLSNNTSEWSYWTHSQMSYNEPDLFTHLWSAWTERDNATPPNYRVLTKHTTFPFFGPGLGGGLSDYGSYYNVLAGQDTASEYCLKRDGVLRFADKAVDFARDSLVYELPYLDPVYDYYLKVYSYRERGNDWAQGFSFNSGPLRTVQFASNRVDPIRVQIPPELYAQDRKVRFVLKNLHGDYVPALGLTLFQRDPKPRGMNGGGQGGPQAGEPVSMPCRDVFAVYPNPVKGQAEIEYSLKTPSSVRLDIYDVTGRLVREVVSGAQPAGVLRATWDGRGDNGRQVSSGIYFLRLTSPGLNKTARFVVVR
jgi:hypothetical protein